MANDAKLRGLAERWLKWDPDPETRLEIQALLDKSDWNELKKRLESRLMFGTAGLRVILSHSKPVLPRDCPLKAVTLLGCFSLRTLENE
jgi:hypothetical protein